MIETERLVVRPFEAGDLDALLALTADEATMRWLGGVQDREASAAWLERQLRHHELHGFARLAVRDRVTGELIGRTGLFHCELGGTDEVELHWSLRSDRWGRGYATEAAAAVLRHARDELGLERIVSAILSRNAASLRVAARLGAVYERDVDWAGEPHGLYVHGAEPRPRGTR